MYLIWWRKWWWHIWIDIDGTITSHPVYRFFMNTILKNLKRECQTIIGTLNCNLVFNELINCNLHVRMKWVKIIILIEHSKKFSLSYASNTCSWLIRFWREHTHIPPPKCWAWFGVHYFSNYAAKSCVQCHIAWSCSLLLFCWIIVGKPNAS